MNVYGNRSNQQFKKFSGDIALFNSEIMQFIGYSGDEELNQFLTFFKLKWDSLEYTPDQQKQIITISNCLIEKKIRPTPDYISFIKALFYFSDSKHDKESFQQWLNGVEKYCSRKKARISIFVQLCTSALNLLDKQLLFESSSTQWKTSNNQFKFITTNELKVEINNTDLICFAKHDSIKIFNTSGFFYPEQMIWRGEKGLVTWERSNYDRNTVNAKLYTYKIELNKSTYKADSVEFTNTNYFKYKLLGVLEDNVMQIMTATSATFPKFDSYQKTFELKNLYKNVDYKGGFSMQGSKLLGKGNDEALATLFFYRNDTLRLKAFSKYLIFTPQKISGNNTGASIYLENDSIYHANLLFTYSVQNREVTLLKSEEFTAQCPFLNSYHKIDMNFEQLVWRINDPILYMNSTPGSAQGKATFESVNFFNYSNYLDIMKYDEQHPLFLLKRYAKKINLQKFYASSYAESLGLPIERIQETLFRLAVEGYIFYDAKNDLIELKTKMYNNLDASVGRIDYDVIKFNSVTDMPLENASLDLRNLDLRINGIPFIQVSDSQNVVFYPKNNQIILKHNRNFQFDGTVQAGLFTFYGKKYIFNYDTFKMTLNDVDSIRIKVITGYDNFMKPITHDVSNVINKLTGELFIDKNDNKSGRINYSQYPLFRSKGNSYVYYDDPNVFKGVYNRSSFYYKVFPFEMDSLDNFKKESMSLKGELTSADIFPPINQALILQPDFSLGFYHTTPGEGLSTYLGKGKFFDVVQLSNGGLVGHGRLNYLTSMTKAKDIYFFPDSANSQAEDFTIASSGASYSDVIGKDIYLHWMPKKDHLYSKSTKTPFDFFGQQGYLTGALDLSPGKLTGSGFMNLIAANASSKLFVFGNKVVQADTMSFQLKSLHGEGFTVLTNNVKAKIDYNSRIGNFKANTDSTSVEFPENKYISYLQTFVWRMDKKELEMGSSQIHKPSGDGAQYGFQDEVLKGAKYISTKKGQDSLYFISPVAIYDYEKNLLKASQVEYVDVADARILPKSKQLTIESNAVMQTIGQCDIMANRSTRFHKIHTARATIAGRYEYSASGRYDYKDINNQIQTIDFTEIKVDTSRQTIANGVITEPDNFTLSPEFSYQGKVKLLGAQKYLNFNGATRLNFMCPNYSSTWTKFDTIINPNNIEIPIRQRIFDINLNRIYAGTYLTVDSIHVYSNFLAQRKDYNDGYIVTAGGQISYNSDSATFLIGQRDKRENRNVYGGLLSINTKSCIHRGEGPVDLNIDCGLFKLASSGSLSHDLNKDKATLDIMLSLDFKLNDQSLAIFAHDLDSLGKDSVDITKGAIRKNYTNLIGQDASNIYYTAFEKEGRPAVMPVELNKTIIITSVKLWWDDVSNSYRSIGKIGIGIANGKQVNAQFDGFMEISRKRSGDLLDLYLKIDDKNWYYFGYTRGVMQVLSSNKNFIAPIAAMKPSQRMTLAKGNQQSYTYLPSPERKKSLFLKRAEKMESVEQDEPEPIELPQDSVDQPTIVVPDSLNKK